MTVANRRSTDKKSPPTGVSYVERLCQAFSLLCAGRKPSESDIVAWHTHENEGLQTWAANNGAASWATGIGIVEAAQALADSPVDGLGHEASDEAFPPKRFAYMSTNPTNALRVKLNTVFGKEWSLTMTSDGGGELVSKNETINFDSALEFDDIVNDDLIQRHESGANEKKMYPQPVELL